MKRTQPEVAESPSSWPRRLESATGRKNLKMILETGIDHHEGVTISLELAAILRNVAAFLGRDGRQSCSFAEQKDEESSWQQAEMVPPSCHTKDKYAGKSTRRNDERSFLRALPACQNTGGNHGKRHTISKSEASCADTFRFIGKEVGPDLLARNSGLFFDLENANQRHAILGPARDGALIDGALPGQIGMSQALLGEK